MRFLRRMTAVLARSSLVGTGMYFSHSESHIASKTAFILFLLKILRNKEAADKKPLKKGGPLKF